MFRPLYRLIFRIKGWKIKGSFPSDLNKYVIAVAPHTSNWDFILGVAARSILRMNRAKYLGKKELFRAPFGWIFTALGGIPVERSRHTNMVEQVAEQFRKRDSLILALAPEGTRKKVEKLKTGFYYIAKAAEVPIILTGFDYGNKEIVIGEPFHPTEDAESDIREITRFFSNIKGKYPELGIG